MMNILSHFMRKCTFLAFINKKIRIDAVLAYLPGLNILKIPGNNVHINNFIIHQLNRTYI